MWISSKLGLSPKEDQPVTPCGLPWKLEKNLPAMQETLVQFLCGSSWKIPWRRDRLSTPEFLGFPGGSAGKEIICNAGDLGSVPGLGRSPGEGKGYPLQYSGLENSRDCIIHGVTKSQTQLRDFRFQVTPRKSNHIFSILRIKRVQPFHGFPQAWTSMTHRAAH